jgi:hypothetical protein
MTEMATEPVTHPERKTPGWQLWARGIEVRLRFLLMIGILAALAAGWPWLRAGWDRLSSLWSLNVAQTGVATDSEYFCPMDPGVVSAWPAICPVCNMDLITRKKTDAVILPEGTVARMQFSPYRVQLAGIKTSPVDVTSEQAGSSGSEQRLTVPVSAVVQHGDEQIVYVETMPGMFDGILVQLGSREGSQYPVLTGLKSGQRVATSGAFLIDAESRLHANIATQYFGAGTASRQPEPPKRRSNSKKSAEPLSEADLALVKQQRICPVTEAPLGSMGTPVFAVIKGRKVFMCCRGCESGLLAEPEKYLAKLTEAGSEPTNSKGDGQQQASP